MEERSGRHARRFSPCFYFLPGLSLLRLPVAQGLHRKCCPGQRCNSPNLPTWLVCREAQEAQEAGQGSSERRGAGGCSASCGGALAAARAAHRTLRSWSEGLYASVQREPCLMVLGPAGLFLLLCAVVA